MSVDDVEVWTEANGDRVTWSIRVNGWDHGGGEVNSHADGFVQAAAYLRDAGPLQLLAVNDRLKAEAVASESNDGRQEDR